MSEDTSGRQEMLHRVAFAIGKVIHKDEPTGSWWNMNADERQRLYGIARAAIAAMREPTEEMVIVAVNKAGESGKLEMLPSNAWRIMIDAAQRDAGA